MPFQRDDSVAVFAALNFVFGGLAACLAIFVALFVYEDVTTPGLSFTEREEAVIAGIMIGAPSFVSAVIFATAGVGLLRRSTWGYTTHLMGAGIAALSCLGAIYSAFAIRFAARESFRNEFFAPPAPPGFAPVFVTTITPTATDPAPIAPPTVHQVKREMGDSLREKRGDPPHAAAEQRE